MKRQEVILMVNVAPIVGFHVSKIAIFQKRIYLTKQIWPLVCLIINYYYYLYANHPQAVSASSPHLPAPSFAKQGMLSTVL